MAWTGGWVIPEVSTCCGAYYRRRERLREAGLLTRIEMARKLKVPPMRIISWRRADRIIGHRSNYKTEFLYEPLSEDAIAKLKKQETK